MLDGDSRTWREGFGDGVRSVAVGTAGQAAVVLEGWEVGGRETTFVEAKCWWSVVALGKWIVENDGVGPIVSSNCDSVK